MDYTEYIKPELLVLIPVLVFLGCAAKQSAVIKDKFIPTLLAAAGVLLAGLYVLATTTLAAPQDAAQAVFTALVQGLLCAAGAVYVDQCVKQSKKSE
nr:MAG TPA: holin [Caudoviricetes sp.]